MIRILYICTHNRCRSILSEAITNQLGAGKIKAYSAGSSPSGEVHPLSLRYLREHGYTTQGLHSQSWDDFEPGASNNGTIDAVDEMDVVITVCDSAAKEACPVWFGQQAKLHWGLADPSKVEGSEQEKRQAFENCIHEIEQRVQKLLSLNTENSAEFKLALQALVDAQAH